jgi:hypothetical protein
MGSCHLIPSTRKVMPHKLEDSGGRGPGLNGSSPERVGLNRPVAPLYLSTNRERPSFPT